MSIQRGKLAPRTTLPTGFPALDAHIGGVPQGQLTEWIGIPTSGVTTLTYSLIASAEQTVYIDLTRHFDPEYASQCGVNLTHMLLLHPPDVSTALQVAHDLLVMADMPLLIMDSGWQPLPIAARDVKRLIATLRSSRCALLWLILHDAYSPVKDVAALRMAFELQQWRIEDDAILGFQTAVHILKNKFAPAPTSLLLDIDLRDI